MRFRLRFLLQEFDLDRDVVVLGRGPSCCVTIDDPMMSREHAKLDLSGPEPVIEDLHSRNGTVLNGRPLIGEATLQDGDRIRIGTQELVFLALGREDRVQRTTGALTFCPACAIPFPRTSASCPHCGAVPEGAAVTTAVRGVAETGWTFHLLSQVVDRALSQNRLADAEKMMSRGVSELEDQLDEGTDVEPNRILQLAECAARLGCALKTVRWIDVSARLHERVFEAPSDELLALLVALDGEPALADALRRLRNAPDGHVDRPSQRAI
ncbi:MAG: FHA domain-containing protein [Polyangiales bacterium]